MANLIVEETKRENDEDNITKRLNKAFESRLDLDRVSEDSSFIWYLFCSKLLIVISGNT